MGTLFYQLPYKEKMGSSDVKSLISKIKKIQEDTGLEFFEVIQVYELQLKITKADTLDEQLAGFGKLIDRFVGNGEFDLGIRYLCDALESISSSLDYIGNTQGDFQFYDKKSHLQENKEELEKRKEEKQ